MSDGKPAKNESQYTGQEHDDTENDDRVADQE
jgi:hypothetical protein